MKRNNRGISGAGAMIVSAGAVVGLGAWIAAIFLFPNSTTNENLTKLQPLAIDPLAASGTATSSGAPNAASSTGGGTSAGPSGTSTTGAASGGGFTAGFTDLPFPP